MAGWIDSVIDKMMDQISHRIGGSEPYSTVEDVQAFTDEVRNHLRPVVDRLAAKLAKDPNWLPKHAPKKGQVTVNPTAEVMNLSLLGVSGK